MKIYNPLANLNEHVDHSSGIPTLIPHPLPTEMLCIGVKRGGQTVIFYNQNREIPDVAQA